MRATEFLIITEGRAMPTIVVDVQPEYAYYTDQNENTCKDIIHFVNSQTGPVLMFVNAEESGVSGDTLAFIKQYWENVDEEDWDDNDPSVVTNPVNWNRFSVVDKGYGHFRAWMDHGISPAAIIRIIRAMYQHKINDSREFEDLDIDPAEIVGSEWDAWMWNDPIIVNWTSVAQLKQFSGAYLVGGGRNECLREVEILMNAFNIKYKRIDSLVYG